MLATLTACTQERQSGVWRKEQSCCYNGRRIHRKTRMLRLSVAMTLTKMRHLAPQEREGGADAHRILTNVWGLGRVAGEV
jgi:hypothetical protein